MELPTSWWKLQKAIVLMGFLLSCVSQVVPAQQKLFVTIDPPKPKVNQNVTLALRGGPTTVGQCSWYRGPKSNPSSLILSYAPDVGIKQTDGGSYTGRETIRPDCALVITKLRKSDTENYAINLTGPPQKGESAQAPTTSEVYQSSIYLQVSDVALTPITIVSKPQHPKPGESVTLIVQGPPKTIEVCKWFRQTPSGTVQSILTYFTGVKAAPDTGPAHSGRETVQRNCSLYITRLTVSDSGNYSLEIEAPPEGRQFDIEEEEEGQKYKGHVYLRVGHDPSSERRNSSSSSLSYSAGVIGGVLLGSLAWTDTIPSLFYMLFRSQTSSPAFP